MSSSSTSTSTSFQFAPIITTNTIRSRSNSPLTPPIDLVNPLPNMSVFIPHMFLNINENRIRKVFDDNQIGQVERVDFVAKLDKNGRKYNSAYIHFNHWYLNTSSYNLQDRIRNPTVQARVVYDDPWYWTVMENTSDDSTLSTAELLVKNAALNANKENIDPKGVSSASASASASACLKQLLGVGATAGQQQQKRIPLQLQVIAVDEDTSLVDCAYVECIEQQNRLLVNRLAEQTQHIDSLEQHIAWLTANFGSIASTPTTPPTTPRNNSTVITTSSSKMTMGELDFDEVNITGLNLINDFELEIAFERVNDIVENR